MSKTRKDVFVRRKDPFGRKSSKRIFDMADYCSVLLMAKTIRESENDLTKVNLSEVPLIRPGGLNSMPEDVAEEFDTMFQTVVGLLEEVDKDHEEFFNKLTMGEIDFVGDIVNSSEFSQAIGNVLMRKYRISRGYTMDEAYDDAKKDFKQVKDEMMKFIGGLLMNCFESLGAEATKRKVPLKHASKLLHPKVMRIEENGVMVETALDMNEWNALKDTKESPSGFDPSFG